VTATGIGASNSAAEYGSGDKMAERHIWLRAQPGTESGTDLSEPERIETYRSGAKTPVL
jgi:hypothetical protein